VPTGDDNNALTGLCPIPPPGWWCSRSPGHEGPCAARVSVVRTLTWYERLWDFWRGRRCRKGNHLWRPSDGPFPKECPQCEAEELAAKPTSFFISVADRDFADTWMRAHGIVKHRESHDGALGGPYTWEFTSTGIGTIVRVRCACGDALDVTDYDTW